MHRESSLEIGQLSNSKDRIYSTIGGGGKFTKLDMSQAYQQLKLNQDSKKYTTINMHIRDCSSTIVYHLEFHRLLRSSNKQ